MISKYISLPVFIISFAVGMLCSYLWGDDLKIIHIFPTPNNVKKIQYVDKSGNCYSYQYKEVQCPSDKSLITETPLQY
jgi:hypothetical protein